MKVLGNSVSLERPDHKQKTRRIARIEASHDVIQP